MFTAISTVVTIAEILKNNGFAVEKSEAFPTPLPSLLLSFLTSNFEGTLLAEIRTLTVDMRDEPGARPIPKAKVNSKSIMSRSIDVLVCFCFGGLVVMELILLWFSGKC